MGASAEAAYDHCAALVREGNRDRYLATLFAPAEARPPLFALYAFSGEIARVRDAVSSPMPGEIRLQWWRDLLEGTARGDAAANPVAAALLETINRFRLPRRALLDLIDARTFDLYDDLWPTIGDLEGYLGETSSALMRLAALVLAGGDDPGGTDAVGHAGVAYGLVGLLRALPFQAGRGQVYLPRDLLERNGVTRDDIVFGRGGPGLLATLAELRAMARRHLAQAEAEGASAVRLACLPASLVPAYLQAMDGRGYDPFRTTVDVADWRKIMILWRASRRA